MSADGVWNATLKTPMGPQTGNLELTTDGDSLSGRFTNSQGASELTDGSVDGDRLTWTVNLTAPMPVKLDFVVTVDGDTMTGDVQLGPYGAATLEASRA